MPTPPVIHQHPYTGASRTSFSGTTSSAQSFVPARFYPEDDEELVPGLNNDTKRAQHVTNPPLNPSRATELAFVQNNLPTGGMPSGGPPRMEDGYLRHTDENGVVWHQLGTWSNGVARRQDLGPTFGTDRTHQDHCRKATRMADNLGTCFCDARRLNERDEQDGEERKP